VEILEIALEVHFVVLPGHPIDSSGSFAFERVECHLERVDVDLVEKRGEPLLLPLPCGLPYAAQRLGHARPGLRPVRALLIRIPLGPCPLLRRLRRRWPGFVWRLPSYYGRVRLLRIVHRRLRLLAFPSRTVYPEGLSANPETSRFPCRERACMPSSSTTPGYPSACDDALEHVAFRYTDSVGTRDQFSIAAQWLACTSPCRRFADILADTCARLGVDAVRYSFIVVDLHHLLLAGLPAHLCKNAKD